MSNHETKACADAKRQRALDQVQDLLRLSDNEGATPAEAAAAAGAAAKIMARHRLSEADVCDAAQDNNQEEVGRDVVWEGGQLSGWRALLLSGLAHPFGCRAVARRGNRARLTLVGSENDRERVAYFYSLLTRQIETASRRARLPYGASARSFRDSFRKGMVSEICRRVKGSCNSARAEASSTALAVVDSRAERTVAYMRETLGTRGKVGVSGASDGGGRAAGIRAGRRAALTEGLNGKSVAGRMA